MLLWSLGVTVGLETVALEPEMKMGGKRSSR